MDLLNLMEVSFFAMKIRPWSAGPQITSIRVLHPPITESMLKQSHQTQKKLVLFECFVMRLFLYTFRFNLAWAGHKHHHCPQCLKLELKKVKKYTHSKIINTWPSNVRKIFFLLNLSALESTLKSLTTKTMTKIINKFESKHRRTQCSRAPTEGERERERLVIITSLFWQIRCP